MQTKIISFHSYKGGSCRSTTCFNTVPFLADELGATPQRPIILVDADLDSMGLTLLLTDKDSNVFEGISSKGIFNGDDAPGKQSIAIDKIDENKFYSRFIPVGERFGKENGAIRFLGVDKNETGSNSATDSSRNTNALDIVFDPLTESHGGDFQGASAIIFDCASGIQHWASMANKLSDVVVICLRPSMQFRTSTFYYLNKKFPDIRRTGSPCKCKVIVLPTAVPGTSITSNAVAQLRREAQETITYLCNQIQSYHWQRYQNLQLCDDMINDKFFGIPEVQRFKLAEGVIYCNKDNDTPDDEKEAYESYKRLAEVIKE